MEENSRQESANPNLLPVLKIKFYWHTAMPIRLCTVSYCFHPAQQNRAVTTETTWSPSLKYLLSGPLGKGLPNPTLDPNNMRSIENKDKLKTSPGMAG